jgi:hypothetical protein
MTGDLCCDNMDWKFVMAVVVTLCVAAAVLMVMLGITGEVTYASPAGHSRWIQDGNYPMQDLNDTNITNYFSGCELAEDGYMYCEVS